MANVPATEAHERCARLLGRRHGRAASGARQLPATTRGTRHDGVADLRTGRLPHRPCRDERARLRPSRSASMGEQPRLLHDGVRRPERSTGAGGTARGGSRGALDATHFRFPRRMPPASSDGLRLIPALLAQARRNLVGNGRDLWTFSAGRRSRPERGTHRPRGEARRWRGNGSRYARSAREGGHGQLRDVARVEDPDQNGPVGHRRRELRLVPQERAARAVHLGGRGAHHGARAGSCPLVAGARGTAQSWSSRARAGRERGRARASVPRCGRRVHGVPPGRTTSSR